MTYLIGITGGSGAGKTYFAKQLCQHIGEEKCELISQDNYYIDRRNIKDHSKINFDHPSSINFELLKQHIELLKTGSEVEIPTYDFATHSRSSKTEIIKPNKITILDGTLIFSQNQISELIDCKIFIATNSKIRLNRRIERDKNERNREHSGIVKQWEQQVEPMYEKYIKNKIGDVDHIVSGIEYRAEILTELIEQIPQIYSK